MDHKRGSFSGKIGFVLSGCEVRSGILKFLDDPFPSLLRCLWRYRGVVGVFGVNRHTLLLTAAVFVRLAEALHKLKVTISAECLGLRGVSLHGWKRVRRCRHLVCEVGRSLVSLCDYVR